MITAFILLADVMSPDPLAWWKWSNSGFRDSVYILGAIAVAILPLLFWAAFVRRRRRRRHSHHHSHHHHHESSAEAATVPANEEAIVRPEKRRRRRHSHHPHRPRNPTLAETGGLPPIRSEEPPEAKP
jgi:hypothetical protein